MQATRRLALSSCFTRRQPLTALLVAAAVMASATVGFAADTVAVFKIRGPVAEQPDQSGLAELLGEAGPTTMFSLIEKMHAARKDENLKGIILDIDSAGLGFAQVQELRAQIKALKGADKDVWVLAESLSNGTMLLGSEASRLLLVPTGEVMINGLYSQGMYFKEMLGKIGVEADMMHCGDFKSAAEPFTRTGPSEEAASQMNRLLDSLFEQMVKDMAESRDLSEQRMRELIDIGMFSAEEAKKAGLVDDLMYREDFVKAVKDRYGSDVKVTASYNKNKKPEIDFNNPFGVFKMFGDLMKPPGVSTDPAVAIVYVEGPITTGPTQQGLFGGSENAGSDTIRRAIAEAADDPSVQALVLRVNSPGGSALASDIICEAAERFKADGRPFVVSMGNVAASGGYYVSTLADAIYADPMTITGSIGVVGGKFVTTGLWDWVGISTHEYKRGARSDLFSTTRKWNDEERTIMMDMMNRIYDDFKGRVTTGRGDKLTGDIESLAGGRVYSGAEALNLGLVDRLGGFSDAIRFAANEANISDYEMRVYPRPKSPFDIFAEILGGAAKEDKFIATPYRSHQFVQQAIGAVSAIDPDKAKVMADFVTHMEMLSKEGVLMLSPCATTFSR